MLMKTNKCIIYSYENQHSYDVDVVIELRSGRRVLYKKYHDITSSILNDMISNYSDIFNGQVTLL